MKKECLLDKITEKIHELIFISTPDDPENFIYISPAYKRLFAIDIEDLQNNSFVYIHINDRDYVKKKFLNLINTGEEYSIEYRIISLDRSVKWMYEIGFSIKEHSDIIYYVRLA
ncbi:MAG: PAS domain-containing protein [Spirochaetota bacterium]|nr:PAS domain-containing protein [Spirochaetota bacterium]